jgi:hypothetical protein
MGQSEAIVLFLRETYFKTCFTEKIPFCPMFHSSPLLRILCADIFIQIYFLIYDQKQRLPALPTFQMCQRTWFKSLISPI